MDMKGFVTLPIFQSENWFLSKLIIQYTISNNTFNRNLESVVECHFFSFGK